jgi:hypothetical protein
VKLDKREKMDFRAQLVQEVKLDKREKMEFKA